MPQEVKTTPNPVDATVLDDVSLDELFKRNPSTLSDGDLRAMVERFRWDRAQWVAKQKSKGKEE